MAVDAEVIVVGSGPAGVSAAAPMVEAGMRVLLVDGGAECEPAPWPGRSYHDLRRQELEQWRLFLGRRLEALDPDRPPTPKFDAPAARPAIAGFAESERIVAEGFTLVGSLARGGLSNIWGAGLALYDDEELAGFPIGVDDLTESYRRVAARIGVTGFAEDALASGLDSRIPCQPELQLADNAALLMARYRRRRRRLESVGLRLGRARNAVLTEPLGEREACRLCDRCLWGCPHGSIWSAAWELAALGRRRGFDYRPGHLVERIARNGEGYRLSGRVRVSTGAEGSFVLAAPRLVLAAGCPTTTRLVLALEGRLGEPVPLLTTPAAAFALCLPGRLGEPVATREFSLAQLSYAVEEPGEELAGRAYGNLFAASGLPAAPILERMPVSRDLAVRLHRLLQPTLVLANCFLPSRYSDSWACLEGGGAAPARLVVRGATSPRLAGRARRLARQLKRGFRLLGARLLPGSFTVAGPGDGLRYGGTLPMDANPGRGRLSRDGELAGAPGLYVADLSGFPALPAKPPVFTMMANADRIGRSIAERWSAERP